MRASALVGQFYVLVGHFVGHFAVPILNIVPVGAIADMNPS